MIAYPRLTLVAGLVLSTLPSLASAQQSGSSLALEEIIVTATKREQSLQDVSVAVTALSEDIIREAQINSSEDLTFLVPSLNLQKSSNPRQSSFNIRGLQPDVCRLHEGGAPWFPTRDRGPGLPIG